MNHPTPPKWADRFLEWFCREDLHDAIRGDLEELYSRNYQQHGPRKAAWLFIWHVLLFFQPFALKRKSILSFLPKHPVMFKHYLKISWRNLFRNKAFFAISIVGLTTGMIALLFIGEYVRFEKSYDQFHEHGENLYRLRAEGWYDDGRKWFRSTANFPVAGPQVADKVPEVEAFARLHTFETILSPQGNEKNQSYKETDVFLADSSFLTMFSFPLIHGDRHTALREPNTIVLTASMARKYFGRMNVVGEVLQSDFDQLLTITGVLADLPEHSHLDFDFLVSYYTVQDRRYYENWGWNTFYTYVQLTPGADIDSLHAQFDAILQERKGDYYESLQGKEFWRLQGLNQIHMHSGFNNEAGDDAAADIIHLLLAVGLFVMLLAWINFVNISTVRAIERGKEVGVRKTIGATRGQMISQFLLEAFLINGLAMVCAVLMVKLLAPAFSTLSGHITAVDIWTQPSFWKMTIGIWVMGSLASGFYPAFVMSSFQPAEVLKGKSTPDGAFPVLRKALVVIQFAIAITIIIGTVSIYRQVQFMRSQDLGFRMEQMYVLSGPRAFPVDSTFEEHLATFRTDLMQTPRIRRFTASQTVPGYGVGVWGGYIRRADQDRSHAKTYGIMGIDDKFLETYEMDLVSGRNFSRDMASDAQAVLINETACKDLEFASPDSAIGKMIFCPLTGNYDGTQARVIGVVKDHHHASLRNGYNPIIFSYNPAAPGYFLPVT